MHPCCHCHRCQVHAAEPPHSVNTQQPVKSPGLATAVGSGPCPSSCSPSAGPIASGGYPSAHTWRPTTEYPTPAGMGSSDTPEGRSLAWMAHMSLAAGSSAGTTTQGGLPVNQSTLHCCDQERANLSLLKNPCNTRTTLTFMQLH
jgi:hypothetical protein